MRMAWFTAHETMPASGHFSGLFQTNPRPHTACLTSLLSCHAVKYILDDGTGLLPCTQYERHASSGVLHEGHASRHELGTLLLVRGKLKSYRG